MKKALIANGIITDVVESTDVFDVAEHPDIFWVNCPNKITSDGTWKYEDGKFLKVVLEDTYTSRVINRKVQYGSIEEQLAMMYDDMVNGTTTWKDHIAKIKSKTPRPGDLLNE